MSAYHHSGDISHRDWNKIIMCEIARSQSAHEFFKHGVKCVDSKISLSFKHYICVLSFPPQSLLSRLFSISVLARLPIPHFEHFSMILLFYFSLWTPICTVQSAIFLCYCPTDAQPKPELYIFSMMYRGPIVDASVIGLNLSHFTHWLHHCGTRQICPSANWICDA